MVIFLPMRNDATVVADHDIFSFRLSVKPPSALAAQSTNHLPVQRNPVIG